MLQQMLRQLSNKTMQHEEEYGVVFMGGESFLSSQLSLALSEDLDTISMTSDMLHYFPLYVHNIEEGEEEEIKVLDGWFLSERSHFSLLHVLKENVKPKVCFLRVRVIY